MSMGTLRASSQTNGYCVALNSLGMNDGFFLYKQSPNYQGLTDNLVPLSLLWFSMFVLYLNTFNV
jgi:hypothetical protein